MKSQIINYEEVELNSICKIFTGFPFKSELFNDQKKGIPIIRIRDLEKGFSNTYYSGKFEKDFLVEKDDLLISMDGEFKICQWKSERALLNQRIAKLIIDKKFIIPKYIFYMISKKLKEIEDKTPFVTVKHISSKQILSIKLILPPISNQKKIVSILEKTEKLKGNRGESEKLTNKYPNAVFLEMFGDPILNTNKLERKNLEELTDRIVVGHVGPTSDNYCKNGIKFLRTQNVRRNKINYDDLAFITPEFHKKLKKSMIFENDVLISRVGVNRGMAAIVPKDLDVANCANIVIVGRSPKFNSIYLSYYLNLTFGKKPEFGYSVGSAQGVVNTSTIKKWPLIMAPLKLQNKFASIVKQVEQLVEYQKKSKLLINNLFSHLMQKSFRGELAC